jgi:hypothetical protein
MHTLLLSPRLLEFVLGQENGIQFLTGTLMPAVCADIMENSERRMFSITTYLKFGNTLTLENLAIDPTRCQHIYETFKQSLSHLVAHSIEKEKTRVSNNQREVCLDLIFPEFGRYSRLSYQAQSLGYVVCKIVGFNNEVAHDVIQQLSLSSQRKLRRNRK